LLTHSSGFQFGPLHVSAASLWVPTIIIAFIYVPYVYRPIRGQVLSVVNKEFVEAAIAQGSGNLRLLFSEVLPNVVSTVIVLLPLMIATTILTESALSFLSIGVQPPNVSWGTIIQDGTDLVYTRPWVTIAPGLMILFTVLSLNVFGDGVRDALDPRAKLRVEGWWQPGPAKAGAHADVHRPAPAVDRPGHVRDHGRRVHHLFQDPRSRPGPRHRGPQPERADPGGNPGAVRARQAASGPVRPDDEE